MLFLGRIKPDLRGEETPERGSLPIWGLGPLVGLEGTERRMQTGEKIRQQLGGDPREPRWAAISTTNSSSLGMPGFCTGRPNTDGKHSGEQYTCTEHGQTLFLVVRPWGHRSATSSVAVVLYWVLAESWRCVECTGGCGQVTHRCCTAVQVAEMFSFFMYLKGQS